MSKSIKALNQHMKFRDGLVKDLSESFNNKQAGLYISSGPEKKGRVKVSDELTGGDRLGKYYPGRTSFGVMRLIARYNSIIRAIINLRAQQVAKMPIKIVPREKEPPRQFDLLKYSSYDIDKHPAFSEADKAYIRDIFERIDPKEITTDKTAKFKELFDKGLISEADAGAIQYLREKHDEFYRKREEDIKKIKKLLNKPDNLFTDSFSWNSFITRLLDDILTMDRGVFIKYRDENTGDLIGLVPVDGATIQPYISKYGFVDLDKAYVQVVDGVYEPVYLKKQDVVIMKMTEVTDVHMFGYGLSPIETLFNVALTDLYIDKSNADFYNKGGTVPEGILNLEPTNSKDSFGMQYSSEQIEAFQRQLTSIMTGDYTQIPIISGAKAEWIDFKGKRRDMQFKELAEYVAKKICMVYQVSPQDIGLLDGFKTSDGKVQSEMTKSKGLRTLMTVISEYITSYVIADIRKEDDLKLWFEEDDLERQKQEWDIISGKLDKGFISINQARAEIGLHPVPWGDTPLQGNSKNWQPPMAGGGAPLPGLPGLPPPPGAAGPMPAPAGGPAGGPPPMDASALPPIAKSFDIFGDYQGTDQDSTDYSSVAEMYLRSVSLPSGASIKEILDYDRAEYTASPYERLGFVAEQFGLNVVKSRNYRESPLFPAYIDGDMIVLDNAAGTDSAINLLAEQIKERSPHVEDVTEIKSYIFNKMPHEFKEEYSDLLKIKKEAPSKVSFLEKLLRNGKR